MAFQVEHHDGNYDCEDAVGKGVDPFGGARLIYIFRAYPDRLFIDFKRLFIDYPGSFILREATLGNWNTIMSKSYYYEPT